MIRDLQLGAVLALSLAAGAPALAQDAATGPGVAASATAPLKLGRPAAGAIRLEPYRQAAPVASEPSTARPDPVVDILASARRDAGADARPDPAWQTTQAHTFHWSRKALETAGDRYYASDVDTGDFARDPPKGPLLGLRRRF